MVFGDERRVSEEFLKGYRVLFMDVVKVWVPLREYLSVQALYDAAIALHWKISERQNSTHLAFLKHQNTKTSLCELSKNHWVIALFKFLGPSEENYNLQSLWITLYAVAMLQLCCCYSVACCKTNPS